MLTLNETKQVQQRLLSMAKAITDILERHDIPYMMEAGTLLGAVRHKGFIPWGDDLDLRLFDDTYDDALDFLKKELPDDCFLEYFDSEPLYFHLWAHVKDVNTAVHSNVFPQDSLYSHKGVSIDLYKATKLRYSEMDHFLNEENRKYIERRKKYNLISDEEYEIRISNWRKDVENEKTNPKTDEKKGFAFPTTYGRAKAWYDYEDVFPLRKYEFEDTEFYGPNNADSILTLKYGDYMRLPPAEKQVGHYDEIRFL